MREPTQQELSELENYFSTSNNVADVSIELIEAKETGWNIEIYYNIVEDGEVIDTVTLDSFLWLDQDEFHIFTNRNKYV
jgi:hypothetical protein